MTYLFAKRIDGKLYLEVSEELVSTLESAGVKVVADGRASTETEQEREDRLVRMGLEEMDRFDDAFRTLAQ